MNNYVNKCSNLGFFDEDDFFQDLFHQYNSKEASRMLKTDIKENEKNFVLDVDVPGLDKKDIKISFEKGYLTINATKNLTEEEKKEHKFIRKERFTGTCSRSYYIGDVSQDSIQASFTNGVLTILIPKQTEKDEASKFIEIQ